MALLYGVTGSGKTQVYIRLIQQVLDRGEAPWSGAEIALTPQLLRVFACPLWTGDCGPSQLLPAWRAVRRVEAEPGAARARVVIGTRSAVFAPLQTCPSLY